MRRALLGAGIAGTLVVSVLVWILNTRLPPPDIPHDTAHRDLRRESQCLACHGVDGPSPRSKNHPLNQQCFQCHVWGGDV